MCAVKKPVFCHSVMLLVHIYSKAGLPNRNEMKHYNKNCLVWVAGLWFQIYESNSSVKILNSKILSKCWNFHKIECLIIFREQIIRPNQLAHHHIGLSFLNIFYSVCIFSEIQGIEGFLYSQNKNKNSRFVIFAPIIISSIKVVLKRNYNYKRQKKKRKYNWDRVGVNVTGTLCLTVYWV